MTTQFWILSAVALVACLILWAIDFDKSTKENKSATSLTMGYAILYVAMILVCWFFNKIPAIVIYGAAVITGAYFGRYFIRKAANRKV